MQSFLTFAWPKAKQEWKSAQLQYSRVGLELALRLPEGRTDSNRLNCHGPFARVGRPSSSAVSK